MQYINQCLNTEDNAVEYLIEKKSVPGSSVCHQNNDNTTEEDIDDNDEEYEDEEDSDSEQGYQPVRTSLVEERAAALSACGAFARACK